MGGLTSAVDWWEEWQLRVLVLSSLAVQFLLFFFSFLRRFYISGWVRFIMWLAYLASDAVAIYALATLFNRHRDQDGGSSSSMLEVVWAPILLIHLGGHDGITAYNIEDNELWSRHLLTAVSQVTVAIYVFCKSWPPGGDRKLLQAAILLFVPGVIKCFVKPWALKSASIYSLVSSSPAAVKQNEDKMYRLETYVEQAKDFAVKQNVDGEVQGSRASSMDDDDRPRCNKDRPGMSIISIVKDNLMEEVRGVWEVTLLAEYVREAWAFVRGLLKDDFGAVSQGSFCGRLRERLRDREREEQARNYLVNEKVKEMIEGRSGASQLFVDLSSSFHGRLSTLKDFWVLREERAYDSVRQGLATAFLLLYTKLKTAGLRDLGLTRDIGVNYICRQCILMLRLVLPWASIGLFHNSQREAQNDIDVKVTYVMICCTAVLEFYSSFSVVLKPTGEAGEEWPQVVAQYSFLGYFARNMKHSKMMWVVSLLGCKDFLDQHWCMKPCFSSARISELILRYLKDGWKEKIHDAASYRRFNNHQSSEGLSLSIERENPLLFDESVLLWHIATEFCFFSISSSSEHRCAFAEVPPVSMPSREMRKIRNGIRERFLMLPTEMRKIRNGIRERSGKCSDERNKRTSSARCSEELTNCKAVLCTQMSNYMAYLLFVNHEMLLPGSRRNIFKAAHQELEAIFKDDDLPLALDNKRELTREIVDKLKSSSQATTSGTFIYEAWMLAQELQSLGDEKKMWEVIQGVWVEMLCFSASRCRGYLHAKALGKGGEFLSYVWLLLFYMGMETFADKLQREQDFPSHESAGNNDNAAPPSTTSEVTSTTGTAASASEFHTDASAAPSTSEICLAQDDMV